jgi:hypothetical protein
MLNNRWHIIGTCSFGLIRPIVQSSSLGNISISHYPHHLHHADSSIINIVLAKNFGMPNISPKARRNAVLGHG